MRRKRFQHNCWAIPCDNSAATRCAICDGWFCDVHRDHGPIGDGPHIQTEKHDLEIRSDSRLKGMDDVVRVFLEAVEAGGASGEWMREKLGITIYESRKIGVPMLASMSLFLAEGDFFKHHAKEMLK